MRGAQEPMPVDGVEDLKVARRKRHGADRRALEARPAGVDFKHQVSVPTGRCTARRQDQPPNHRSIFASISSRGRPYRSRERRMTAARLPRAVPWIGGKVRPRKGSRIRPWSRSRA